MNAARLPSAVAYAGHGDIRAWLVLTVQGQWDESIWPLLVVQNEGMNTTRLHVAAFTEEEHSNERAMLALPAIASLPMLILFVSLSRYFLRGANLFSATKG